MVVGVPPRAEVSKVPESGIEPVPVHAPRPVQDMVELVTGSVTPAPRSLTVSAGVGTGAPSVMPVVVMRAGEPDEPTAHEAFGQAFRMYMFL